MSVSKFEKFTLMKLKARSLSSGFTIIELLVVFTVIAILAGVGLASFVSYSRSQQVNQTANNLKLLINEAKFNSLSVVKTAKSEDGTQVSCGSEVLTGYTVSVVGNNRLQLSLVCETSGSTLLKTVTLPSGVTFVSATPATNCTQIQFGSLTTIAAGVPCSLKVNGFGQTKTITVDAVGNTTVL